MYSCKTHQTDSKKLHCFLWFFGSLAVAQLTDLVAKLINVSPEFGYDHRELIAATLELDDLVDVALS